MTAAPSRNFLLVVAWMAGSLLSFSAIALSIRALHGTFSVFEILALRNLGALPSSRSWRWPRRGPTGA